jgi:hypothetical protein
MSSSAMYTIHCQQNHISSWKHKKYNQHGITNTSHYKEDSFFLEETTVNLTHEIDQQV